MHDLAGWWNRISLRTKVTGVTVLLLTAGLIVAGVGTAAVLRSYLQDELDAKIVAAAVKLDEIQPMGSADDPQCPTSELPNELYLAVVDARGNIVCSNRPAGSARPEVEALTLETVSRIEDEITLPSTEPGGQWRVGAYPATDNTGTDYYTVALGLDLKDTNGIVARYAAIFLFFGLTVVIVGGALTRLLVTSTFAPLRDVEATAARFAAGDFNQRMSGATPNTEVGRLNASLNAMLSRIDSAFADRARTIQQMRRFVGDASHELRTPLVSVRGYAELYRMGALTKPEDVAQAMERIEKEAIRMGGLVEDLLELARLDETKPLALTEVDLVPLAGDAALDAMASSPDRVVTVVVIEPPARTDSEEPPAEDPNPPTKVLELGDTKTPTPSRGMTALATGPIAFAGALRRLARRGAANRAIPTPPHIELPKPDVHLRAVVLAEENKIRQVLANLIGNAMRFTPAGSPIEIGVGVDPERERAVLAVIDHGEGIPPQVRGKIFERFWRADNSRTRETGGSGLGLAIVAAIVDAHKGEVEIVDTPGGGATFRVLLPLLPSTQPDAEATVSQ
ncbi:two-component system OmpR family sensor kinase [Microbacteriaceae bacterium SG_E_30_P1]|uniref:histidine kinase n=1 Tax=Antiquaquibacter oligotrophicus TaxID=2880260 RepID=A0ABT6KKC1_9MICO|nr:HAMP domain-containing sensor histidine kinase [Antiquaquibacter oligotrophicus]MDH6180145.1 two-component system OmpR family sensor kinase [Antiquaquibacter oligotrophicus]UDF14103.1 HAMP domain-containing histidine kinase [Antiquaquibacter oligotrophicus]